MLERRRLIVNADDFALHPAVNQAVFLAHREGIVTSTTVLAGGIAFFNAVEELQKCPHLGVGAHLCLVDRRPVLPPEKIPSLVNKEGRFCTSYPGFIRRLLLKKINLAEVQQELEAQISRLLDSGLKLTHLDSHQHLHLLPGIYQIVADIGRKAGLCAIRTGAERSPLAARSRSPLSRRLQGKIVCRLGEKRRDFFQREGFRCADHFVGFLRGGSFLLEDWLGLIPELPAGTTEVMVHPGADARTLQEQTGWGYHWEEELRALLHPEVRSLLTKNNIELINYGDLV